MSRPFRSAFRPAPRPLRGFGPGQVFSVPALGRALAASIGLHGALALGGLAWMGALFLRGAEQQTPPAISVQSRTPVAVLEEARPVLEFEPPVIAEPELQPVFEEEEEEIFPVDWMTRPPAHPRREDLYAVDRSVEVESDPPPEPEPETPEPEPPAPELDEPPVVESESATVTASPASQVEASFDPDPELSPPPRYPGIAIRRGWEGTVLLTATISADGRLLALEVSRSSGRKVLDDAALDAVRNWKPGAFRPAIRDGQAAEGQVPIQFRFQIEADSGDRR